VSCVVGWRRRVKRLSGRGSETLRQDAIPRVMQASEEVNLRVDRIPQRRRDDAGQVYPGHPLSIAMLDRFDDALRNIQDWLNLVGYVCLAEDGYFGPATGAAVREFPVVLRHRLSRAGLPRYAAMRRVHPRSRCPSSRSTD
jgi:hypothetical protein